MIHFASHLEETVFAAAFIDGCHIHGMKSAEERAEALSYAVKIVEALRLANLELVKRTGLSVAT